MTQSATLRKPAGYPLYQDIVDYLAESARVHPGLCRWYPIGRSLEGREILCCELTCAATGPAADKPAYYIDANHHAGEVTGASTALYTIWYLLTNYGRLDEVTKLLDEQAFYVIPRVAVDGSEVYLTTPQTLRSSVRPYPAPEPKEGLYPADIDGDGEILAMRVADPDGPFAVSAEDDRLMIRRRPGETGGRYYRVYTEGLMRDWDGVEVKPAPPKWGLDFNRNYPGTWAPESDQKGAGEFPASEPEVRAVVEFFRAHPNIAGAMSHHTFGGIILRAHCVRPDAKLPKTDLAAMKALGEIGLARTGYPIWSIYEQFTMDKSRPSRGSWMDWVYDLNGALPLATELWDMSQQAGLPKRTPKQIMSMSAAEQERIQLALLRWNDRALAGRGFVRWRPFDHPQLGPVELGGWLPKTVWQNAPLELLEGECHKAALFTLDHAAMAPRLAVADLAAADLGPAEDGGGRLYKVTAVVENRGYLPTNVTEQALATKVAKPLRAELAAEGEMTVVAGRRREEIGQLPGHGGARSSWGFASPATRKRLAWVVAAKPGTKLTLTVSGPKVGKHRTELVL